MSSPSLCFFTSLNMFIIFIPTQWVSTKLYGSCLIFVYNQCSPNVHVTVDEADQERRRTECLDDMADLEKQFTDLKEQ